MSTARRAHRLGGEAFSLLSRHEQIVTFKTLKFQFLGFNGLLGSRFHRLEPGALCARPTMHSGGPRDSRPTPSPGAASGSIARR